MSTYRSVDNLATNSRPVNPLAGRVDHRQRNGAPAIVTQTDRTAAEPTEEREDGRSRIVAHALRLFLEHGYADVSMQQIAEAAGLRKASIYHHFRDKNALFTEIVLFHMRETLSALEAIIGEQQDVRAMLEAVATTYLRSIRSDLIRLFSDYRRHVPETEHDEVHAELFRLGALFERIFDRAMADGAELTVQPKFAGAFFMHMMMALLSHINGEMSLDIEPEEGARMVTSALLDGIVRR